MGTRPAAELVDQEGAAAAGDRAGRMTAAEPKRKLKLPPAAVREALVQAKGDVEEAARILGTRKSALCPRIVDLGLEDLAVMPWRDMSRSRLVALLKANGWRVRWTARDLRCWPALVHRLMARWGIERPADSTFNEADLPLGGEAGDVYVARRIRLPLSLYRALWARRAVLRKEIGGRRRSVGLGVVLERLLADASQPHVA
jgi:hypothetical protein